MNMTVWKPPSTSREPVTTLESWEVIEATGSDGITTRHFVGRETSYNSGRVSSPIQSFDKSQNRGITNSGRVYRLEGPPGSSPNADYVWQLWAIANGITSQKDVTKEYFSYPENTA